jgi:putative membrane protein
MSTRRPQAFPIEAPRFVKEAPRRAPRAVAKIEFDSDEPVQEIVPVPPPPRRRWRLGALLAAALAGLVSLYAGLATTRLVEDLFQRSAVFGWIGLALAVLAGIAALAIILREFWGLVRLARIEGIQEDAARALSSNGLVQARHRRAETALRGTARYGVGNVGDRRA